MRQGMLSVIVCVGLGACTALAATDGTYWSVDYSATSSAADKNRWFDGVIPGGGGIATLPASPADHTINNTIDNWTLGGFALTGYLGSISGNPITLTGDAVLSGTGNAKFLCTVQAAVETRLEKRGTGSISLAYPLSGFTSISNIFGTIIATGESGTVFADSAVTMMGGALKWAPSCAAGTESVAATVGGDTLKVCGNVELDIVRGNAATATLTVPTLDLSERAPVLKILPSGGSPALGVSEKVKVAGAAPEVVNGLVDPRIVSRSDAPGNPITFLTYDETDGFKPVEATGAITDADAAKKIVKIAADTTLPGNAAVGALVVEGTPNITGKTLTVGDGKHPAGVIFNDTGTGTVPFNSVGTLAFGDAPGILWQNHASSSDGVWAGVGGIVNLPTITGTKGVTFASWKPNGYCNFTPGEVAAAWTGPTRILGSVRYSHLYTKCLPSEGDVFVEGGELYTTYGMTYNEKLHFHFAGHGGLSAAYRTGGAPDVNFSGPVTVMDTTRVFHDNNGSLSFKGGVDGKGGFELVNNGRLSFLSPCTFEGGVTTDSNAVRIYAWGTGTMGTGPIVAICNREKPSEDSGAMRFEDNHGENFGAIVHPNVFKITGYGMDIYNSNVAFTKTLNSTRTRIRDRARIGVGSQVTLGDTQMQGNVDFLAVADEARLDFSVAEDRTAAFDTADGEGGKRLSVAKGGEGTLTWYGSHTHTGQTTIRQGTVKLGADVFTSPSLRYWLDAADDSTYTIGENGYVSEWRSKVGEMKFTAQKLGDYQFYGPVQTETLNNRKVLSFRKDVGANIYQRLCGSAAVPNRHLFMVVRIASGQEANYGFFGQWNKDYGLRVSWNGALEFYPQGAFATRNFMINGKETSFYPVDQYCLIEAFHDEFDGNVSATKNVTFQPVIGGYFPWTTWRNADCDIAEILDFDRILPDASRIAVENYLQKKWGIANFEQKPTAPVPVLSPGSDLVLLGTSATLDLNGSSETVRSLSGYGLITNSSPEAATLKVAGACDFKGTIAANVKLDLSAGGAAKLGTLNALPVRDGVAFWVDASYKPDEYVLRDGAGVVTSWVCRAGTVARFEPTGNATRPTPKVWSATDFPGGKPAVFFDGKQGEFGESLRASANCSIRTLFIVGQYVSSAGNSGFFGLDATDVGFRNSWGTGFRVVDGPTRCGDEIYVNDNDYTGQPYANLAASGVSFVRVRCSQVRDQFTNRRFALGQYIHWNLGEKFRMAEVIAYDRRLTDDEFFAVTTYLKGKWSVDRPLPADGEDNRPFELAELTVGPGSTTFAGDLVATGDWTFDFGNLTELAAPLLTIDGTLSLGKANARFVNHTNLTTYVTFPYLKATEIEGDFASTDLDQRRFERKATADGQSLLRMRPGAIIVVW